MKIRASARWAIVIIAGFGLTAGASAGTPSKKAAYQGGTLASVETPTVGSLSALDSDKFVFQHPTGALEIPYGQFNSIEYGQKSKRRLGLSIAVSPLFLLTKKRKHFLTLSYVDGDGRQQAAVFELGKKIVRTTLAGLEARTGLMVEYEDDQARRAAGQ